MSLLHPIIAHNFEKMGFYPTDEQTLDIITRSIVPNDALGITLVDPCCGEGTAIAVLKSNCCPYGQTLGAELDQTRFEAAKHTMDHIICADALNEVKFTRAAASVMFLNPPYGQSSVSERQEYAFIKKYIHALAVDGLFILVVPSYVINQKMAQYLCSHCQNLSFGLSPEQKFRQVIIMGTKIKTAQATNISERAKQMVNAITKEALFAIPEVKYHIPATGKNFKLYSLNITANSINTMLGNGASTLWEGFKRDFAQTEDAYPNPLMALSEWHTAQAILSGMISGVVQSDQRKMLVKGTVNKKLSEAVTTVGANGNKIQQTEKFVPMIIGIDVTPGSENFGTLYQIN